MFGVTKLLVAAASRTEKRSAGPGDADPRAQSRPRLVEHVVDRIADGAFALGPTHTYRLDQIHEAHRDMETNAVSGKLVVLTTVDSTPLTSEQPGSADESQ